MSCQTFQLSRTKDYAYTKAISVSNTGTWISSQGKTLPKLGDSWLDSLILLWVRKTSLGLASLEHKRGSQETITFRFQFEEKKPGSSIGLFMKNRLGNSKERKMVKIRPDWKSKNPGSSHTFDMYVLAMQS